MYVVKPIHKNVKNLKTGIDITVPTVLEIEAPLGGTSIEYEIFVVTNLTVFKSQIHKEDEVVQFSVQKAYKEIEIFHDKVSKKWKNADLPSLPKGRASLTHSAEEKRKWLEAFMLYIANDTEISHSPLFNQFIGITRLKNPKTTAVVKSSETQTVENDTITPTVSDHDTISPDATENTVCDESSNGTEEITDLFPKMKVQKSDQSDPLNDCTDAAESKVSLTKHDSTSDNDQDLFEDLLRKQKISTLEAQLIESEKSIHEALFCDTDEDADLFRINSPTPPKPNKEIKNNVFSEKIEAAPTKPKELGLFEEHVSSDDEKGSKKLFWNDKKVYDDPFQEKKFGNVPLFQKQDLQFGGITKDEARLFYIPKEEIKKSKINPFLSPSSESTDEDDVDESIEELTSLAVPSAAFVPPMSTREKVPDRKTREPIINRPEILPKPELPKKPQVAARKPPVPSKPTLPPKPKIANKPITVSKTETGSLETETLVNHKSTSDVQNLNTIDIMQYIEQEQQASSTNANLFD